MSSILIKNVNVVTACGDEVLENTSIAIKDDKIIAIEDMSKNPSNYDKIIDGNDNFLLPGFIDAHVHIMANGFLNVDYMNDPLSYYFCKGIKNMKVTLEAGVTTARDCGLADVGIKRAAENKIIKSPKFQISVIPLSITGGHFDLYLNSGHDMIVTYPGFPHPVCDGVEGAIAKTREVLRARADFVKVMATGGVVSANDAPEDIQFNVKELKAIVDEAKRMGNRKVVTHCHGLGGIKTSIKAKVHSIEHGTFVDKKSAEKIAEKGIFLVPTFSVIKAQIKQAKNRELPPDKIPKALEVGKVHQENMEMAYNQGVKMVMGTDSGVHEHGKNLAELNYLHKMGMDPLETIRAGTIESAKCLELENEIGSIEKGKIADIVLTNIDPRDSISKLQNPDNILMVMQDGKIVKSNI
ncbi:metal-dependent hydrolase family protein [Methanobrevibacter filiformis]|uniref:Imidazolonepropionase n=1 Tax=Methanobrevibacter filiformis TaxID=55758 RepID=A0A166D6R6_9EURY|nr:amidohydrolase family protein [Methanobrevibacter filiformis]KZX15262.1 imidazolonepropionase [Methanobrevibacter filiformis]